MYLCMLFHIYIYIYIYEDVRLTLCLFIGHWKKRPRSIIPRHRFGDDDQVGSSMIFVRLEASWEQSWEPIGGARTLKIPRNSMNFSLVLMRLGSPPEAQKH